tara:strand:- start:1355 stop:2011 length:657 start_codon:yes stop_codon:yes gene_type:complete
MKKFKHFWLGNIAYAVILPILIFLFLLAWGQVNHASLIPSEDIVHLTQFFNKELILEGSNVDVVESEVDLVHNMFLTWAFATGFIGLLALAALIALTALHRTWMWGKITKKNYLLSLKITAYRALGWLLIFYVSYEFVDEMNYIWPPAVIALALLGTQAISKTPITARIIYATIIGLVVTLLLTSASVFLGLISYWLVPVALLLLWTAYAAFVQVQFT